MSRHQNHPGPKPGFDAENSILDSSDQEREKPADQPPADSNLPTKSQFPDGGLSAWLVVLGAWACFFSSYGFVTSIGVFQDYYEVHFLHDYTPSEISWILSIQAFFVSATAPFAGAFFDRNGPHLLVGVGSALIILGLFTLSASTQYYQIFLSQSVSCGLGMGMIFHGSVNSVSTWFLKRRGLALGIASSGSGVGGVILPIFFDQLVDRIGFPWTVRAMGFLILGIQIIAVLTVRSRLEHTPKPFHIRNFSKPLKDRAFVLNSIACLAGMLGTLIPFNYLKVASQVAGVSSSLAIYLLPIINASSIIGRILPLWAGDHVGAFNTITALMLYGAVLVLALWIPAAANINAIVAFTALFGVPLGCFNAIIPALVGKISAIEEIGFRVGTTFFVVSIAALIGNPLAGLLIGKGWTDGAESYHGLKLFCGLSVAVSGLLFLATRIQIAGWGLNKKI
ncbi:putative MFS general substrate transporter [Rosellinia necatrix]|uniref:Putative MFS general substrate transporter n=1 Tax=Rosellinia necatrix TaxID=77044 RepID=A0A1S7URB4_ROSNE|nr:putative MFS general substrate transporter [Rosellinia necatrix]